MVFLAGSVVGLANADVVPPAPFPADAAIREILQQVVDHDKRSVGIVVGLTEGSADGKWRVIGHGSAGPNVTRPLDGDTIFEIGSITKTMTATILADMILRGEVGPDDPISKYLPKKASPPRRAGRDITLRDLATHASGLPRMPSNFNPKDPANPFADYTAEMLYEWLSSIDLERDIGALREYSNAGYGLLGHILELKTGKSYDELFKARLGSPLKMADTGTVLTAEQKSRLAIGHDQDRKPVANWDLGAMAGAGALRSNVHDMLRYVDANLQVGKTGLEATMTAAQKMDIAIGDGKEKVCLAWGEAPDMHGRRIWWHNGGTGGYHSFVGFDPAARRGVVVLSNCTTSIDDIGFHLLQPKYPIRRNPEPVRLPRETLDRYVGVYQIDENVFREVTRFGDRVFVQRTGQPPREIFAEKEDWFFDREIGIRLRFDRDSSGKVSGMMLYQVDGAESPAKRVDRPLTQQRRPVDVDPAKYDGLVGKYQLGPDHVFTVTRDADRLMVGLTGQETLEVFPESADKFFYTIVDAQLSFERDASGKATRLILHQHGLEQPAARME